MIRCLYLKSKAWMSDSSLPLKFLGSSSFPTHNLPFNRFGIGIPHLVEANQEDGIVFLLSLSLSLLVGSYWKNEGESAENWLSKKAKCRHHHLSFFLFLSCIF